MFPLTELDTSLYRKLDAIIRDLEADGFTVERVGVPYEFQKGTTEMMRVY